MVQYLAQKFGIMEELLADPQQVKGERETLQQLMHCNRAAASKHRAELFRLMVADILADAGADLNSKAGFFALGLAGIFQNCRLIRLQSIHPAGTNIEVLAHAEGATLIVTMKKAL